MPPDDLAAFLRVQDFDARAYRARYVDLAGLSEDEAREHFALFGNAEGRRPSFRRNMGEVVAALVALALADDPWRADKARLLLTDQLARAEGGGDWTQVIALLTPTPDYRSALIIGDSHSAFLLEAEPMLAGGILPAPLICTGGSARGLGNAASRAGYGPMIAARLRALGRILEGKVVLFKFGQVDLEFVFDMKRLRAGRADYAIDEAQAFVRQSVDRYVRFLDRCRSLTPGLIVVMSVFPPTLRDEVLAGGYVNAHIAYLNEEDNVEELRSRLADLDQPSLADRTGLARRFNEQLRERCTAIGMPFLEEFDALLSEDGIVRPDLSRGDDHHLVLHTPYARSRIKAVAQSLAVMA